MLRPVFDQKRENLRWRKPPWVSLAGISSMAQLDYSQVMDEAETLATVSSGDVVDWYFRLRLPMHLWEFFSLDLTTEELYELYEMETKSD